MFLNERTHNEILVTNTYQLVYDVWQWVFFCMCWANLEAFAFIYFHNCLSRFRFILPCFWKLILPYYFLCKGVFRKGVVARIVNSNSDVNWYDWRGVHNQCLYFQSYVCVGYSSATRGCEQIFETLVGKYRTTDFRYWHSSLSVYIFCILIKTGKRSDIKLIFRRRVISVTSTNNGFHRFH